MGENCTYTIQARSTDVLDALKPDLSMQMWQVNGLLLLNAVLMGVVIGVGAYAPRYRSHPVTGVLFLGATTLFLPITSTVASTTGSLQHFFNLVFGAIFFDMDCDQDWRHRILVLVWTVLVVITGINASVVVAGDAREGRNVDPPIVLLIKAIWTAYLTSTVVEWPTSTDTPGTATRQINILLDQLFAIMFMKLVLKYSIFYVARQSMGFGRGPRLIAGYMAQLQQTGESHSTSPTDQEVRDRHATLSPITPPALVVLGEDNAEVEKQPHGYSFKMRSDRLVTLDRVWRMDDMDMRLQMPMSTQAKDLCFSFALFKLLRCRFAKYTVSEAGFVKTRKFFRETLLQGDCYERVFQVIADELSFIHDYYYSSLPNYYSHYLLPFLSITLSLYSIGYYCVYLTVFVLKQTDPRDPQITCSVWFNPSICDHPPSFDLGSMFFDLVPVYAVVVVLVLAEMRDIVAYICSNWTKVYLMYYHVNQASWQRSPIVQKCIGFLLKSRRCKLVNNWNDKMKLCSILSHPRKIPLHLRHLLHLRDRKKEVKVPPAVKAAIFDALKGEIFTGEQEGALRHILPPSSLISGSTAAEICRSSLNACDGKRPAYIILAWHIATAIFEMRHPQPSDPECHKIAATHLSGYCAYLMTYCPELLPDDDEWCKKLYDDVKEDAVRVVSAAPGAGYQRTVELLSAGSSHDVLKDGARLGKQLVDSRTGWDALARFWSQMILYVAPSENLEGHAEAIGRGGELITLLWALLAHAGIVGRLDADATGDAGPGRV